MMKYILILLIVLLYHANYILAAGGLGGCSYQKTCIECLTTTPVKIPFITEGKFCKFCPSRFVTDKFPVDDDVRTYTHRMFGACIDESSSSPQAGWTSKTSQGGCNILPTDSKSAIDGWLIPGKSKSDAAKRGYYTLSEAKKICNSYKSRQYVKKKPPSISASLGHKNGQGLQDTRRSLYVLSKLSEDVNRILNLRSVDPAGFAELFPDIKSSDSFLSRAMSKWSKSSLWSFSKATAKIIAGPKAAIIFQVLDWGETALNHGKNIATKVTEMLEKRDPLYLDKKGGKASTTTFDDVTYELLISQYLKLLKFVRLDLAEEPSSPKYKKTLANRVAKDRKRQSKTKTSVKLLEMMSKTKPTKRIPVSKVGTTRVYRDALEVIKQARERIKRKAVIGSTNAILDSTKVFIYEFNDNPIVTLTKTGVKTLIAGAAGTAAGVGSVAASFGLGTGAAPAIGVAAGTATGAALNGGDLALSEGLKDSATVAIKNRLYYLLAALYQYEANIRGILWSSFNSKSELAQTKMFCDITDYTVPNHGCASGFYCKREFVFFPDTKGARLRAQQRSHGFCAPTYQKRVDNGVLCTLHSDCLSGHCSYGEVVGVDENKKEVKLSVRSRSVSTQEEFINPPNTKLDVVSRVQATHGICLMAVRRDSKKCDVISPEHEYKECRDLKRFGILPNSLRNKKHEPKVSTDIYHAGTYGEKHKYGEKIKKPKQDIAFHKKGLKNRPAKTIV